MLRGGAQKASGRERATQTEDASCAVPGPGESRVPHTVEKEAVLQHGAGTEVQQASGLARSSRDG